MDNERQGGAGKRRNKQGGRARGGKLRDRRSLRVPMTQPHARSQALVPGAGGGREGGSG